MDHVLKNADLTWVTVCEQGADGQQHLGDGEGGAPVVLQDVQTDHPLTVDVAVIDPRTKCDLHTQTRCGSDMQKDGKYTTLICLAQENGTF